MLYALLCFLGFAAAGVLGAFTAIDWFSVLDSPLTILGRENIENLRNSVTATSVSECLAADSLLLEHKLNLAHLV